jgi:hypothetical protein
MSSERALSGERTMSQMFPEYIGAYTTQWAKYKTWQNSLANPQVIWNETYFDMAGYTQDDMTVFPIGINLQDPGIYIASNANVPMQVVDIVSQVRLDPGAVLADLVLNNLPGMMESDTDWLQILWGQYRTFLGQAQYQANNTIFLPASGGLFGSGSPSTAEKIYCYRFIITQGAGDGDTMSIPASRMVMSAVTAAESEQVFLMRQKRSYELAS